MCLWRCQAGLPAAPRESPGVTQQQELGAQSHETPFPSISWEMGQQECWSEPLVSDSSSLELLEQQLLVFGVRSFQNPQERSNSGKSRSFRRTNSFFCAFGALVQQHFLTIKAS